MLQEELRTEMRGKSAAFSVLLDGAGGGPKYGGTFIHKQLYKCTNFATTVTVLSFDGEKT